ncbi:MAG: TauD/TfdA family dioxygenase [Acidimicrobiales bacterium]
MTIAAAPRPRPAGPRPRPATDDAPGLSGLRALLESIAVPTPLSRAGLTAPLVEGVVPVLLVDDVDAETLGHLADHLDRGGRAVVATSTRGLASLSPLTLAAGADDLATGTLAAPDPSDPLVLDPHLAARGVGPLDGTTLEADDLVALPTGTGRTVAAVDHRPVLAESTSRGGTLVVIGSQGALTNRWLAAADNAAIVHWAVTGRLDAGAGRLVRDHHPDIRSGHAPITEIDNARDDALLALLPDRDEPVGSPDFLRAAAHAGRLLSAPVHDALVDLVDEGAPAGAILIHDLPVGDVPATPSAPTDATSKDSVSEFVLLTVARRLGQPVGYEPEHGGQVVQNLLPTAADAGRQTSTSSAVDLEFHTETAFHRHKPRYLLLLCLKGDPEARTLLCAIGEVVDRLPLGVRQVLREPRFRTGIDESFTGERTDRLGHLVPVLAGTEESPTFTFDADLMVGIDDEAAAALEALRVAIRQEHVGVALRTGDMLVVDNSVSVHGRSSFQARFDGTDRWLQRTFVVSDLAASATERRGRVITTRFS